MPDLGIEIRVPQSPDYGFHDAIQENGIPGNSAFGCDEGHNETCITSQEGRLASGNVISVKSREDTSRFTYSFRFQSGDMILPLFGPTAGSKPLPLCTITFCTHPSSTPPSEGIVHAKDYGNTRWKSGCCIGCLSSERSDRDLSNHSVLAHGRMGGPMER